MPAPTAIDSHLADPVTRHMRTDFARLHVGHTVGEAIATIRARPPEGRIIYFYVVDDGDRLQGVVPTRRLLLDHESTPIRDIMVRRVTAIPADATVLDACEFFLLHRLLAFPVVDDEKRIVGIVDVDLYTEELADVDRREDSEALFQLIGVHLQESQQSSPVSAFRSRFPWLIANISGGIVAAFLSGAFAVELQKLVALALFIPVVLALAESVSIQSVSLALQSLRGGRPTLASIVKKLRTESLTGLLLGLAGGAAVAAVAAIWLRDPRLVWCLLGGIGGGVACAAVVGTLLPNLLRLMHREPQVAAGPIALAITDMLTLLVYFLLARAVIA